MIDETKLFFLKQVKNKMKFYFTSKNKHIEEYKKYFNRFQRGPFLMSEKAASERVGEGDKVNVMV